MHMKNLGKKKVKNILRRLENIRRTATMENASFYLNKENKDWLKMGNEADTNKIKEATHLWRSSWIILPLDEVIKELESILA